MSDALNQTKVQDNEKQEDLLMRRPTKHVFEEYVNRVRVGWGNTPTIFREIDSWENLSDISLIYWMYHLVYYLS